MTGYIFYKIHLKENIKFIRYKHIILCSIVQGLSSIIIFNLGPINNFKNLIVEASLILAVVFPSISIIILNFVVKIRNLLFIRATLEYEQSLFSSVLLNLYNSVIIMNKNFQILRINQSGKSLFGINSEEFIEKNFL